MTDPISDMLTRIRNAALVNQSEVSLPHSQAKESVAKILVKNGFLADTKVSSSGQFIQLQIQINPDSESAKFTHLKRLSRPGQRHYVKAAAIPKVRRGRGVVIISTSQGVMTGEDARAKKLGGELICEVF